MVLLPRYKFYQADHLLVFDREAASRFIPSFWRVAKDPTHYLENTPGGSPEWQLFSHLGHLGETALATRPVPSRPVPPPTHVLMVGIDVRLLDLRHTDRLLSFDSWRCFAYPAPSALHHPSVKPLLCYSYTVHLCHHRRYEDTKARLRAAEIATHCVSRHGGGGSLVRPPKRSSSTHHDVWSPAATPSRIRHAAKARGTSTARPCGRGRGRPCR